MIEPPRMEQVCEFLKWARPHLGKCKTNLDDISTARIKGAWAVVDREGDEERPLAWFGCEADAEAVGRRLAKEKADEADQERRVDD